MTEPKIGREHWTKRAPWSLLNPGACSREDCADPTTQDRRWPWRLESFLAINGTNAGHRDMGADLRQYLNEACRHHWHTYEKDEVVPAHRQCTWCSDVEIGALMRGTPLWVPMPAASEEENPSA